MTCKFCGGYVEWKGPIMALTHTECHGCGCVGCQETDDDEGEDEPAVTPMEDRWDYDHGPDHMREVIEDSLRNADVEPPREMNAK